MGLLRIPTYSSTLGIGTPTFTGDFNGDGKLDIASSATLSSSCCGFSILLGNGDGTFQAPITNTLNQETLCGSSPGDFNGDGKLDVLACVNGTGMPNGIAVVLGNGDGTFQSAGTPFPLSFSPGSVEVADLNGDGKLDLVAVDFSGSVAILLGNGDGTFQPAVTYSIGNGLGGMDEAVIADFNTDGKLDIASIASFDTGPAIIYGNGDGTFGAPQSFAVPNASPTAAGDFNGDGIPDLAATGLVPNSSQSALGVLIQHLPTVSVSPSSLTFGTFIVTTSSSPQAVTVTNGGEVPLNVTSILAAGNFSQTNNCPSTLAVGATCTVNVVFTPTGTGLRQNYLTITDTAPGSPTILTLTGEGTDFTVFPNPPSSLTVAPGQVANFSVAVFPAAVDMTVAMNCTTTAPQSTCAATPSSLALNGPGPFNVSAAVVTTAVSAGLVTPTGFPSLRVLLALGFPLVVGFIVPWRGKNKARSRTFQALGLISVLSAGLLLPSCGGSSSGGGGGSTGTPQGTYK